MLRQDNGPTSATPASADETTESCQEVLQKNSVAETPLSSTDHAVKHLLLRTAETLALVERLLRNNRDHDYVLEMLRGWRREQLVTSERVLEKGKEHVELAQNLLDRGQQQGAIRRVEALSVARKVLDDTYQDINLADTLLAERHEELGLALKLLDDRWQQLSLVQSVLHNRLEDLHMLQRGLERGRHVWVTRQLLSVARQTVTLLNDLFAQRSDQKELMEELLGAKLEERGLVVKLLLVKRLLADVCRRLLGEDDRLPCTPETMSHRQKQLLLERSV